MIAQTERVDFELAIAAIGRQHQLSRRVAKLFEVTFGELSLGVAGWFRRDPLIPAFLAQLAAPSGRNRHIVNFERGFRVWIALERLGRIGHLERILQHADFAVIADAMPLERLDYFELCATGIMSVVVLDLGPLKHEADGSVRKVEARGHLGVTFVGAITQSDKTAEALTAIVEIVICTFVEIGLAGVGMHQVVLLKQYHFGFRH